MAEPSTFRTRWRWASRLRLSVATRLALGVAAAVACCIGGELVLQERLEADLARASVAQPDSARGEAPPLPPPAARAPEALEAPFRRARRDLLAAGGIALGLSLLAGRALGRRLDRSPRIPSAQEIGLLGSFEVDIEKGRAAAVRGSDQLRALLGLGPGESTLSTASLVESIHPEDREPVLETFQRALDGGGDIQLELRLRLPDGVERRVWAQARHVAKAPGSLDGRFEGTLQDATHRQHALEQIRYLSHHDPLTGLGNRTLLGERLALAIERARRRRHPVAVLAVNLDQFRRINDSLGQRLGDELLRRVADRVAQSLRASDLVARCGGSGGALSRVAGDEFVVLIDEAGSAQDVSFIAQRLLDALARPFQLAGHELVVGGSIGVAIWPDDGDDVDALLRSAGSALGHAKQRGGGRHVFYDESMNRAVTRILALESRLRRALSGDEFELHYQPQLTLASGRVDGLEALLRWRDPDSGLRLPGEFIRVAEQSGLIGPLGRFALRRACEQLVRWGAGWPALRLAVNLSAQQFRHGALVDEISAVLAETGARPDRLELEITESAVLRDAAAVVADLEQLRDMGMRIALDDFGTGQSSLSHLRHLPVDTLKIDMSFVQTIAESEADARLTASIVGLGRARGLWVVAEGVETETQRRLLEGWGCDAIQGHLISPALPPREAIRLAGRLVPSKGDPTRG